MTGAIVLVIGVIALFAAIVGGGIKFKDIEVGSVPSLWRQGLLGIFGLVVTLIGLGLVTGVLDLGNSTETSQNVEAADQGNSSAVPETTTGDSNSADQNATGAASTDANGTEPVAENSAQETAPQ